MEAGARYTGKGFVSLLPCEVKQTNQKELLVNMRVQVHLAFARKAGDIAKLEQRMIRDVVERFNRDAEPYRLSFGLVVRHRASARSASAAVPSAVRCMQLLGRRRRARNVIEHSGEYELVHRIQGVPVRHTE